MFTEKMSNAECPTPSAQLKSKKFSDFVFAAGSTHLDSNRELRSFRAEISAADVRRSGGTSPRLTHAQECRRAEPAGPRLSVRRAAWHRENFDRAHFGESPQLREGANP